MVTKIEKSFNFLLINEATLDMFGERFVKISSLFQILSDIHLKLNITLNYDAL